MHAHITSWTPGPEAIYASSTFLEGYTPFEDRCMRIILAGTPLSDIKTGTKAANLDLDDCKSAIWMTQIVTVTRMMVRWTSALHQRQVIDA